MLLPATGAAVSVVGLLLTLALGSFVVRWGVPPVSAFAPLGAAGDTTFAIRVVELPEKVDRSVLGNLNTLLKGIPETGGAVVVRVARAATLANDPNALTDLDSIFRRRAVLAVQAVSSQAVSLAGPATGGPPDLGTAGSLLLAVAGHRFADWDEARAALSHNHGLAPSCAKECQDQVAGTPAERTAGMYTTSDDSFFLAVVLGRAAQVETLGNLTDPAQPSASPSPTAQPTVTPAGSPPAQPHSVLSSILSTLAYVLVACAMLLLGFAIGRRRRGHAGEESASDADSMDGGRTQSRPVSPVAPPNIAVSQLGTVHSAFGPQGYVAVDGGLYRARWMGGPDAPRPRVGSQVVLRMHEVDGLQAWPAQGRSGPRP
ncbi:hypothetical protein [Frankia sp. CiP3]|uniref:hypothetical protein n=1 Tax=Frankia sp. CiP3 TaxID=2880971 RepID=UPI001EF5D995|nr:hypothetical protein [Frankia sp. CiP3]